MGTMTARQSRFVDEYLIDTNGNQAALRAGYRAKHMGNTVLHLMRNPRVRQAIAARQAELRDKLELTQEQIIRELYDGGNEARMHGDHPDFKAFVRSRELIGRHLGMVFAEKSSRPVGDMRQITIVEVRLPVGDEAECVAPIEAEDSDGDGDDSSAV